MFWTLAINFPFFDPEKFPGGDSEKGLAYFTLLIMRPPTERHKMDIHVVPIYTPGRVAKDITMSFAISAACTAGMLGGMAAYGLAAEALSARRKKKTLKSV